MSYPGPVLAFQNQSATNAVSGVLDNYAPKANHSVFIIAGAGVTAGAVQLQVSNDNVNWVAAGSAVTTAAPGVFQGSFVGPFQYVRAAISTAITGGTVTAYVASA